MKSISIVTCCDNTIKEGRELFYFKLINTVIRIYVRSQLIMSEEHNTFYFYSRAELAMRLHPMLVGVK